MNDLLRTILFLPPQSSTVAAEIDYLHYAVISVTMGGATLVTLAAIWFCFRYRQKDSATSPNASPPPREERGPKPPPWFEAGVIGGLFSLFLLFWVIGFLQYIRIRVPPEDTLDIYVTGKQWMWKFAYPEGQHGIGTLYVPAGRPIKLILTSRDVIHSFYVPDFRLKQDAVPGRVTTLWFTVKEPGTHRVFCAEYCGANHSVMRAEIVALSPTDYARWLESAVHDEDLGGAVYEEPFVVGQAPPKKDLSLVRLGELAAAQYGCLRCHTLDGTPHIGPTWAGLYGSTVPLNGGGRVYADEAYLTESMMDPLAKVRDGYAPVMPSFQGYLRPGETAAIIQLIKSLRDVRGEEEIAPNLRLPAPKRWAEEPGAMGMPPIQPKAPERLIPIPPIPGPPPSQQGMPPPAAQGMPLPQPPPASIQYMPEEGTHPVPVPMQPLPGEEGPR